MYKKIRSGKIIIKNSTPFCSQYGCFLLYSKFSDVFTVKPSEHLGGKKACTGLMDLFFSLHQNLVCHHHLFHSAGNLNISFVYYWEKHKDSRDCVLLRTKLGIWSLQTMGSLVLFSLSKGSNFYTKWSGHLPQQKRAEALVRCLRLRMQNAAAGKSHLPSPTGSINPLLLLMFWKTCCLERSKLLKLFGNKARIYSSWIHIWYFNFF